VASPASLQKRFDSVDEIAKDGHGISVGFGDEGYSIRMRPIANRLFVTQGLHGVDA
jgi:hypothetical protein